MFTHSPHVDDGRRSDDHRKLPVVMVPRPRCPRCQGTALKKYRSIRDQGDGTAVAWVRCRDCNHRFKVIME